MNEIFNVMQFTENPQSVGWSLPVEALVSYITWRLHKLYTSEGWVIES